MALIPQEEIQKIRASVNIVDIISSYIPLDHKGKNYFGVCPFHNDHSPSMSVSEEKQIYKCFSCGAAGNVFTFIENYENISFLEAVELVAKRQGLNLNIPNSTYKIDKNSKYYEIMNVALMYFENNLKSQAGDNAIKYLEQRKLNKDIIKEFQIGLALKEKDYLYQILKSKKYSDEDISKVALVNFDKYPYDNFTNRIMFPLHDIKGNLIGFSGRLYDKTDGPKYLNTRETVIFKKGEMLFNYYKAKTFIRNEKQVIIVEGYMDAIRLFSSGIKNVIAIMGTSLTKEQINIIKKLNSEVVICLDNDQAGLKATYEIGNALKEYNIEIKVIRLSGNKDPDEYIINQGVDAFRNNLKNPLKFFEFSLNYLKNNKNLNETEDLAKYINEVLKELENEEDEILIDLTLKKLSNEYNIDYDILESKLSKIKKLDTSIKKQEKETKNVNESKLKLNKYEKIVENILFFMMNNEKYVRIYQNDLIYFNNLKYREIANEIIYFVQTNNTINIADFLSFAVNNELVYKDVLNIINTCSDNNIDEKTFYDYLNTLKNYNKKITIEELKHEMKQEMDKNKSTVLGAIYKVSILLTDKKMKMLIMLVHIFFIIGF